MSSSLLWVFVPGNSVLDNDVAQVPTCTTSLWLGKNYWAKVLVMLLQALAQVRHTI